MAVTPQTTYKSIYPAHNCIDFEFLMDDLGDGVTNKKDFGYRLEDGSDGIYAPTESYKPINNSDIFPRDLSNILRHEVSTAIPTNSATPVEDTDIIKPAKLKFGEIITDLSVSPCETTESITQESDLFYVTNSALNSENISRIDDIVLLGNGLLHQRPRYWYLQKGQMDFLWHLGQGSVDLTYYNVSGGVISTITHTFGAGDAFKVNIISLDPYINGIVQDISKILIQVKDAGSNVNETYTAYINCTIPAVNGYVGLLFLEPLGGRAPFGTETIIKAELTRSSNDVFKNFDCQATNFKQGGNSLINTKGVRKRVFRTQLETTYENLQYIENFFSSPGHHVQRLTGASAVLEKCTLENGNYTSFVKNEVTLVEYTVSMSETVNNQRSDK